MINVGKIILLILLTGGCVKKELPPPKQAPGMSSAPRETEGLKLELKLDRPSYKLKKPARMTFTVANRSNKPFQDSFRSAQAYDFIVRKGGKEIWRWSYDRMFAQVLLDVKIDPGKTLSYSETWDQRDNAGNFVSAGRYEVVGVLKTTPEKVSSPVTIEIAD